MDANGTRFLLLMGQPDWSGCREVVDETITRPLAGELDSTGRGAFEWCRETQALMLRRELNLHLASQRDTVVKLSDRRGADRDQFGNCYWISDDERSICVRSSGDGLVGLFWPPNPQPGETAIADGGFHPVVPVQPDPPPLLRGLVVCDEGILLAGLPDSGQLLVFDLWGGGAPTTWTWPPEHPFVPWDMAPRAAGGAWILDRQNRRLWIVTRQGFVPVEAEQPEDAPSGSFHDTTATEPVQLAPAPRWRSWSLENTLTNHQDPIAVATLGDDSAVVLWRDESRNASGLCLILEGRVAGASVSLSEALQVVLPQDNPPRTFLAHDFAVIPAAEGETSQRLVVMEQQGNQAFEFEFNFKTDSPVVHALTTFWPTRSFTGKGLLNRGAVSYDSGEVWYPLVAMHRPRHRQRGTIETSHSDTPSDQPGTFDSQLPDCVWHRVLLDLNLPPHAAVRLQSRAANSPDDLRSTAWSDEPVPYRRGDGGEIAYLASTRPDCHQGTWEVLLQGARGRHLQLRIEFEGDGRVTPRLHALRVYAPRFSYLERYLPRLYSEDAASASFLERFLANLEGLSTTLEDQVASVELLFDPGSTPREYLDWLAGWMGVVLDPAWDEPRRRLFLKNAPRFFARRGTARGLLWALRLALDPCLDPDLFEDGAATERAGGIRILEHHRLRRFTKGVPAAALWHPAQGLVNLQQRYLAFQGPATKSPDRFQLNPPPDTQPRWTEFCRQVLGFIPSHADRDLPGWRQFLQRRHGSLQRLNAAWNSSHPDFGAIGFDETLLESPVALEDWHQYQSRVLAIGRAAHRFTVLLPLTDALIADPDQARQQLELARRIVARECPAHCVFDVAFHSDRFRVGTVRLGDPTAIGFGARDPRMRPPFRLGFAPLATSPLASPQDPLSSQRFVVGRDAPAPSSSR